MLPIEKIRDLESRLRRHTSDDLGRAVVVLTAEELEGLLTSAKAMYQYFTEVK